MEPAKKDNDFLYKIGILGEINCGKPGLFKRILHDQQSLNYHGAMKMISDTGDSLSLLVS